jgi:amidase
MPPSRRELLAAAAAGLAVAAAPPGDFAEGTVAGLQDAMKAGRLTARALAEACLARIDAIDRKGPALRSVIETDPDALSAADALDKERRTKGPRGPLHGIPVLLKDNIATAGRMLTTAGSLALVKSHPGMDAPLVKALRRAGAVILGKTNMTEWANFRCSYATSGWSGRGGLTRNPFALDRNPSGSSSGSAAAVAAELCPLAVGTETDGSIISPSSVNGIVGLKPTVGLVSRTGVIPISHSQDTAGPMARTVRDVAILLGTLVCADDDPATKSKSRKAHGDYTAFLDPRGLKGARLGVARNLFGFHDATDAVAEKALVTLKKLGAILIDPADVPNVNDVATPELTVFLYEFKAGVEAYLARIPGSPVKKLKEIIAFNEKERPREMPYFGQDTLIRSEGKGGLDNYEYQEALARCRRLMRTEGIDAVMDKHKLDAIVAPAAGPACLTDLLLGDRGAGGASTPAAVAGYPSISVPMGHVFGLPVGLAFFGRPWSEGTLLKYAYAFEQETKARTPPRFAATADLRV